MSDRDLPISSPLVEEDQGRGAFSTDKVRGNNSLPLTPSHKGREDFLKKRLRKERCFRLYGKLALIFSMAMLAILLASIAGRGIRGFEQTQIRLPIAFNNAPVDDRASAYNRLAQSALLLLFPEAAGEQHRLFQLVSLSAGGELKHLHQVHAQTNEIWLPASADVDACFKDELRCFSEGDDKLDPKQIAWLKTLAQKGDIRLAFDSGFFTHGDSRLPEHAGFLSAMVGSALTLFICLIVVFPIGVMTAIYLEEYARKGRLVDIIEVNINNLAAVPSIVFGLLGLAVYINLLGLPRSAPLVGGLTLALMILPVIIITTRASLAAVPPSVRDAALGLGASPLQVVLHHSLPLAMPGIMTGTILGMARAIGETAPLLMIGMVAFVADVPSGFMSPATAMPVEIYLWATSPESGFAEKTASGILVLLMLLLAMNSLAIYLRKKFEVRW